MITRKFHIFPPTSLVGILLLINGYCLAEKAPYTSFAKDAKSAPPAMYNYDYIIIGGGTAGCPLSTTLSSSARVLVLERGGLPYDNPNITNRSNFQALLADTSPNSAAQLFVSTDGVFNLRGRVLGGTSAINGGFFTHSSAEYVHEVGWDPLMVNESYEWVQRKVAFWPQVTAWQTAVRSGLLEAGVLPDRGFTYEHLQGTKIGAFIFDENGTRHSAADFLEYADPTNITVYLNATVQQILFNTSSTASSGKKPKAYGVFFKDSRGVRHMAYLNNEATSEIILSAGALGSPQLLMLSGIGPAQQLMAQKIKVILDQPMVGQGMSDNPGISILVPVVRPIEESSSGAVGISDVGSFIEAASGVNMLVLLGRLVENYAELTNQSIDSFTIPINQTFLEPLPQFDPYEIPTNQTTMIMEKVAGPFSKGYLELQSRDSNDNPRVTFNYFQDHRDLHRCVQGMEIIRRVVESRSLSSFLYPNTSFQSLMNIRLTSPVNLRKKHLTPTYSMEQFCIDTVTTFYHYHGGCQVDRVVDHDYRVVGVDALRVIDGSTFNDSPGANPQATLMMLGRYMGQKILRERTSH